MSKSCLENWFDHLMVLLLEMYMENQMVTKMGLMRAHG